jgi:hypothetical protein
MNKTALALALIFAFLVSVFTGFGPVGFAAANPDGTFPNLAMPVEHVNYTITPINDSLWAVIDGNYPISILSQPGCTFQGDLPMVYPMPPGATDIHVYLGDQELSWSNYSQNYPDALHHTAIGDWSMISCVLSNVSGSFLLKIHYEHPLQTVNGSYLFLYDLNISPYLTEQSNNSTCYYTIRVETNATNIQTYTTATDAQWNPINYTATQEGSTKIISVAEHSVYNQPLPGDFVFEFSDANQIPEFPLWGITAMFLGTFLVMFLFFKRQKLRIFERIG